MFDRAGIIDHLNELSESLRDWERYKGTVTLEELMNDRDKRNMVLHAMLVTIQACIDIANHIVAERRLRRPATYSEAFEILVEEKVIPMDLGQPPFRSSEIQKRNHTCLLEDRPEKGIRHTPEGYVPRPGVLEDREGTDCETKIVCTALWLLQLSRF